jgi:hypothetical protein
LPQLFNHKAGIVIAEHQNIPFKAVAAEQKAVQAMLAET